MDMQELRGVVYRMVVGKSLTFEIGGWGGIHCTFIRRRIGSVIAVAARGRVCGFVIS
jgi:hypothetical protein